MRDSRIPGVGLSEGERAGRSGAISRASLAALGLCAAACGAAVVRNDAHAVYEPAELGRDGFVRVRGLNVHYVDAGPTEPDADPAATPIVLIPGAFSTYRVWSRVLPRLAARHRVVALDYVGTGDSDKPEEGFDYSVDEEADVVVGLLREVGLEKPLLAGVSYGASIALNVAARYPDLPSRVVCIEGGVVIDPDVLAYSACDRVFALPLFGDIVLGVTRLGLLKESIAKSVMGDAWDGLTPEERAEIVAIQTSFLQTVTRPAMYDVYRAITSDIDFSKEMERERAPILYLYGEASRYRAVAEANLALFRERRCNVAPVLVKDGIHDLELQYPGAVAAILREEAALAADPAAVARPAGEATIESVPCVRGPNFAEAPRSGGTTGVGSASLRSRAKQTMGDVPRPIPWLDPGE
jgi:pimeloyl-ACP methyl ester carboxylesterase